MKINKVILSKHWVHSSGRTASIRGACPWTSDSDKPNWELQTNGFTWEVVDYRGNITYGACRKPAKTYNEAITFMNDFNSQ